MCENKLYFQKPQVESMYRNLCLCASTPRQGSNAARRGTRELAVPSLRAQELCCLLCHVFNSMI